MNKSVRSTLHKLHRRDGLPAVPSLPPVIQRNVLHRIPGCMPDTIPYRAEIARGRLESPEFPDSGYGGDLTLDCRSPDSIATG